MANQKQIIKDRDDFTMKPKGIWIAICMILSIGIFSTDYIKKRTEVFVEIDAATKASSEFAENSASQTKIQMHSLSVATIPMTEATDPSESMAENAVLLRLQELDEQLTQNQYRKSEIPANSRIAFAENEWRMWESELQRILEVLKEKLDPKVQESLMYQQIEWMKSREEKAVDASQKQIGSAMEEVNYNRSLAELTRARAYELAETYSEFLTE